MAGLNETPSSERLRVAFFGLRNAGKSTLVNAFTGQNAAIVSDVPGTTTDPVSKAMEILPLGPCLVTDTAGLDDTGELGEKRVGRTLEVLSTTDVAVWVGAGGASEKSFHDRFAAECAKRGTAVVEYKRGDSVEELLGKVAAARPVRKEAGLLEGIVREGDIVLCVCPIDSSAPKGRLILPQVQLVRECLDRHLTCVVCRTEELEKSLSLAVGRVLVVTDSQVFPRVASVLRKSGREDVDLTSFSILSAKKKGILGASIEAFDAIGKLKDGDLVVIAEGCTHHRQCEDIGTVKIPRALLSMSGKNLKFAFTSGGTFSLSAFGGRASLVVHCGGCMLSDREIARRAALCAEAGVPVVNYGMLLAYASSLRDVGEDGLVDFRR